MTLPLLSYKDKINFSTLSGVKTNLFHYAKSNLWNDISVVSIESTKSWLSKGKVSEEMNKNIGKDY